jgi:hypothetical protein
LPTIAKIPCCVGEDDFERRKDQTVDPRTTEFPRDVQEEATEEGSTEELNTFYPAPAARWTV